MTTEEVHGVYTYGARRRLRVPPLHGVAMRAMLPFILIASVLGAGTLLPRALPQETHRATVFVDGPHAPVEATPQVIVQAAPTPLPRRERPAGPQELVLENGRRVFVPPAEATPAAILIERQATAAPTLSPASRTEAPALAAETAAPTLDPTAPPTLEATQPPATEAPGTGTIEPQPTATTPPVTPPPASGPRAAEVQALLAGYPLEPYADLMVQAADANGIDWRLIPVISYLESLGGTAACGYNAWGYNACNSTFASWEEGIWAVASTLAGEPYAGENIETKLCIWVSGQACNNPLALHYLENAAIVFQHFGVWLIMPQVAPTPTPQAMPLTQVVNREPAATPLVPEPERTPTPPGR